MAVSLLLDSVILIDHLRDIPAASDYLRSQMGRCAISVVTRAEVLSGFAGAPPPEVLALLDYFPVLGIDREVADQAVSLRREYRWRLPDAFQAALARVHGLKLVTRNTKDFSPARHEMVEIPYSL